MPCACSSRSMKGQLSSFANTNLCSCSNPSRVAISLQRLCSHWTTLSCLKCTILDYKALFIALIMHTLAKMVLMTIAKLTSSSRAWKVQRLRLRVVFLFSNSQKLSMLKMNNPTKVWDAEPILTGQRCPFPTCHSRFSYRQLCVITAHDLSSFYLVA